MNKRIKKKHIPNTYAKYGFAQKHMYSEYITIRMIMSSDVSVISKTNFKRAHRYMRGLYNKMNLFCDKIIELNFIWKAVYEMIENESTESIIRITNFKRYKLK